MQRSHSLGVDGLSVQQTQHGEHEPRGKITKAGDAHLPRVLVEAASHYRHRRGTGKALKKRRKGQPEAVVSIGERADHESQVPADGGPLQQETCDRRGGHGACGSTLKKPDLATLHQRAA